MDENFKKFLSVLLVAVGGGIFCVVVLVKVECWAAQTKAELKLLSSDLAWQDFLYSKSVKEVQKNFN